MHFIVSFLLLFTLASGAPIDLVTNLTDTSPVVYDEAKPLYYGSTEANELMEEAVEEPEPNLTLHLSETFNSTRDELLERPMHEETIILNAGKHLSEAITAKIVGPVVIFNSKVAAAAGALPPMLAAKGAVIGSAIATPIEIGAVVGSSIVSGVTGKLVALPISVATGAVAKFVGAAENGRHIWNFSAEHGKEIFKDGVIKLGHIILKPIAIIVGAQTALNGVGLGIAGTGIKGVGVGMEAVGTKMFATGLVAKGLGHRLIAAQFPPYL